MGNVTAMWQISKLLFVRSSVNVCHVITEVFLLHRVYPIDPKFTGPLFLFRFGFLRLCL